ncbi:MAG: ERCC4 domain-containing protein [Promethearchaeota archaeon]
MNNENHDNNENIEEEEEREEDLFMVILKDNMGENINLNKNELDEPYIIVDSRESKKIIEELKNLGANVIAETLDAGDYLLSSSVAAERKRADDFYSSLIRGSGDTNVFDELMRLKESVEIPLLILEDFNKMFERNEKMVAPLYGALIAIATQMSISIIPTRNFKDTALVLYRTAKQQQCIVKDHAIARRVPKSMSLKQRQKYFLEGFYNIGPAKSQKLIDIFRSPMNFINALIGTEILYTKTGKPKGIEGPLKSVKGIGWKFVMDNQNLLLNENMDQNEKILKNKEQNEE